MACKAKWLAGFDRMVEKDLQTIRHILSLIGENTTVSHPENVRDESQVTGCARVLDNALLLERAKIGWDVVVSENAVIRGDSVLVGTSRVSGHAQVADSDVYGDTEISGHAVMKFSVARDSVVTDHAQVYGSYITRTHVEGAVIVKILDVKDSILMGNPTAQGIEGRLLSIHDVHWWSDVP